MKQSTETAKKIQRGVADTGMQRLRGPPPIEAGRKQPNSTTVQAAQ